MGNNFLSLFNPLSGYPPVHILNGSWMALVSALNTSEILLMSQQPAAAGMQKKDPWQCDFLGHLAANVCFYATWKMPSVNKICIMIHSCESNLQTQEL